MATLFQIGEVCQRTGLTPRALHYYDEIGLLVPSERLTGGYRLYSAADVERIERIRDLKRLLGLSLGEIKRILDAEEARERYLVAAEAATDPVRRRRAVENALRVTEEQQRSIKEKAQQIGRLERKLDMLVRDLRRLLSRTGAGVTRTAASARLYPASARLSSAPGRAEEGMGKRL
jgi:MerR family transcriptional regulator, repressor of the yfmOP operon